VKYIDQLLKQGSEIRNLWRSYITVDLFDSFNEVGMYLCSSQCVNNPVNRLCNHKFIDLNLIDF